MSLLAALVTLAAAASPYTPEVPPDAALSTAKQAPTHEVQCNDPQTMNDCHHKARELCGGEFTVVREVETDRKKGGKKGGGKKGRTLTIPASTGGSGSGGKAGEQRSMTFTCPEPKK